VDEVRTAVTEAKGRWARLQQERPSVRHLVKAWELLQRNNGNQYAAAITYFSFLALFPLLLLAVAVVGFVLHAHPETLASLFNKITTKVPGQFGDTLKTSIKSAIDARAGVGAIGLAGVLLTGLGWIGNLRTATDAVWGRPAAKQKFLRSKLSNLVVLAGLGVGILASLGLTIVGTAVTDQVLRGLSLDDLPGSTAVVKILGVLLSILGDMVIFGWVLVRLPAVDVPRVIEVKGALFAAVAFEVLKVVGTYTIAHTANSATSGPFAGILAVLIWIQLVARSMLFCCAWTAVLTTEEAAARRRAHESPRPIGGPSPTSVAADQDGLRERDLRLVGAGAAAGAFATWITLRGKRPR
jgi:membrane protein